jgi:hypothetical protein
MNEDWQVLLTFFPDNWLDLAVECKVAKNLLNNISPVQAGTS